MGPAKKLLMLATRSGPRNCARISNFLSSFEVGYTSKKCVMNRSVESKLRDAVRFLGDGIKEKPKTKHPPRKTSMEQRLMEAKKAFRRRWYFFRLHFCRWSAFSRLVSLLCGLFHV